MTVWDTIVRAQGTADQYGFGTEWRAFVETRTLQAAELASFKLHLARLGVDDEDESYELAELWSRTESVIGDIKRRMRYAQSAG